MNTLFAVLLGAGLALLAGRAQANELVFLDNDFSGPGETNIEALYPALADPGVTLLGIGAVTGDAWRDEGMAHLLAFLDQTGCGSVPVYPGAEMPLVRTQVEMGAWEKRFGNLLWKGAWQPHGAKHKEQHPDRPDFIPPLVEGAPHSRPASSSAAAAMIEAVHRYPHQVTIVAGGPLTDLALAIRLDAQFAPLARQLVFMGGLIDTDATQIALETAKARDFYTDFNMIFDPEAAHIVLSAAWAKVVNLGDVTETISLTETLVAGAGAGRANAPQASYFKHYARVGVPMWDELTMAVAIHPDLVTASATATMDVDTAGGLYYGRAHARPAALAPDDSPAVEIVTGIDRDAFYRIFKSTFTAPFQCRR